MAKRTTRKTASRKKTATRKRSTRTTKGRKATGRKTAVRAGTRSKTARRKNAARATASRAAKRRKRAAPPSAIGSAATTVKGAVAGAVAAVSRKLPWTSGELDAIALLERDHRRLEQLLAQGEETTERAIKTRGELLKTLTAELNVHELIEEKVLYPALRSHPEAKEIVLEGYEEHHVADLIVRELHGMTKDNERWGAKFKVLKENIEHHIKEEEGEMFRTARGVLGRDELQALGARMAAMKASAERAG